MKLHKSSSKSGFSLLEIVIAISVLAIIAGVMTLRSGSLIEKGRVTNALETIDTLKKACVMYHLDTGTFAREFGGAGLNARRLSGTQTVNGWSGPYIDGQLPVNANPWAGTTRVYNTVNANGWIPGFDVDGNGTNEVTTAGNMVYMSRVDESSAQRIDDHIDKTTPGNWNETGRVRYLSGNSLLLVLVHY